MLPFLQEWWAFIVVFVFATVLAMQFLRMAGDAWKKGDWKDAAQRTVGPMVSFLIFTSIGMAAFSWGFGNVFTQLESSIPAKGIIALGNGGMALIAGGLEAAPEVKAPDTALPAVLENALRSVTGSPAGVQESAPANNTQASAPAANENVAPPASNWGLVREVAPVQPTREFIGPVAPTVAPPAVMQGPAPAPTQGPVEKPTFVDPASVLGGGGPQTYTVKSGDSMAKIAKAVGQADYRAICAANRDIVGNNCDVIRSGQVLVIP